jgi:hypothetical protein
LLIVHPRKLRGRWWGLLLFFALPALLVTPMALYLRQHPELEQRLGQVGAEILSGLRSGDPVPLIKSAFATSKMFSLKGDPEWLYNISGRPVLDPLTSVLFYGGLLFALWRWRQPQRAFLLLWLAVGISPTLLSWPPGSLGHSIAIQPAVYCIPALTLVDLLGWTERRRWAKGRRWQHPAALSFVALALLVFASINVYDYFCRWPRFPDVQHEYQAPITAVARYVAQQDVPADVAVSAPYVDYWHPWSRWNYDLFAAEFGTAAKANVRWFNGRDSLLFPAAQGTLIFLPDHIRLPSALAPELETLLRSGARALETGYTDLSGATFDVVTWQDRTALDRRLKEVGKAVVWASPESAYTPGASEQARAAQALPLDFGARLSFLGYSYASDEAQTGATWSVTTYWRVLEADPATRHTPLAIFVHALDDANRVVMGWDGLHASVDTWQAGDSFVQMHALYTPPQTPAGDYRVELGIYSPVSLERLPIQLARPGETAPHGRLLLQPLAIR